MVVRADPINLEVGQQLGFLGLEMHTRRRNRMNGRVLVNDGQGLLLHVDQSFGNCPKYIQVVLEYCSRSRFQGFAVAQACAQSAAVAQARSCQAQCQPSTEVKARFAKKCVAKGSRSFNTLRYPLRSFATELVLLAVGYMIDLL